MRPRLRHNILEVHEDTRSQPQPRSPSRRWLLKQDRQALLILPIRSLLFEKIFGTPLTLKGEFEVPDEAGRFNETFDFSHAPPDEGVVSRDQARQHWFL